MLKPPQGLGTDFSALHNAEVVRCDLPDKLKPDTLLEFGLPTQNHRLDPAIPESSPDWSCSPARQHRKPATSRASAPPFAVRRRSAWSNPFIASLELVRQDEVVLGQERDFQPIHLARVKRSH
jgi:hypothetical protein